MKFSLFTEIQCPQEASPATRLEEFLEQAEAADTLGYRGFWIAEIHCQPRFSLLSAPYTVLGAVSQRTRRLRLGVAVNIVAVHHPVQTAEQAAMLDLLSHGRMDFAAGGGHPHTRVYECFGVNQDKTREIMEEGLKIIQSAWTDDVLRFEGQFFRIPGVIVNPKPLQRPHPPIYIAASSPDGVEFAAAALKQLINETGATHILAWMNMGSARHDLVLESMKQFARDLMPRLESYHPDRRSSLSLAQY